MIQGISRKFKNLIIMTRKDAAITGADTRLTQNETGRAEIFSSVFFFSAMCHGPTSQKLSFTFDVFFLSQ